MYRKYLFIIINLQKSRDTSPLNNKILKLTKLSLTFGLYEIIFPLGLDQVPGSLGQARHHQQDDRQVAGSAHHCLLTMHARYSSLYSDLQLLEKIENAHAGSGCKIKSKGSTGNGVFRTFVPKLGKS
jgi:hypothetical protein